MKRRNAVKAFYDWVDAFLVALCLVVAVFTFIIKSYIIDGSSMAPTYNTNDHVIALSLFYTPKQGDVVIIDKNNGSNLPLIKRVVATEFQTVNINRVTGEVTVDEIPFDAPIPASVDNVEGDLNYPVVVPQNCVFVMGDNRGVSNDSRYSSVGFINEMSIVGKAVFKFKLGGK